MNWYSGFCPTGETKEECCCLEGVPLNFDRILGYLLSHNLKGVVRHVPPFKFWVSEVVNVINAYLEVASNLYNIDDGDGLASEYLYKLLIELREEIDCCLINATVRYNEANLAWGVYNEATSEDERKAAYRIFSKLSMKSESRDQIKLLSKAEDEIINLGRRCLMISPYCLPRGPKCDARGVTHKLVYIQHLPKKSIL